MITKTFISDLSRQFVGDPKITFRDHKRGREP